jgi:CBS domain-containing protein
MTNLADVMTPNPACCTLQSSIQEAARIMRDHDCGIVPVVEDSSNMRLIGVVTDRDIVIRILADGNGAASYTVADCLTRDVRSLTPDASLMDCRQLMESSQVRRVPVVDANSRLVGIVSMADLADELSDDEMGKTLTEVSEPDNRQLYSEVHEETRSANEVTPDVDPTQERQVAA